MNRNRNQLTRTETERLIYALAPHDSTFSWLRTLRAVLALPERAEAPR